VAHAVAMSDVDRTVCSGGEPNKPTSSRKKKKKECMCGNSETCKGLTAAFSILEDPRKRFVRIPHFRTVTTANNLVREAYLKYILPSHPIHEETPSKYIAAHHFSPIVVCSTEAAVPRTLTKSQMARLGIELEDCMFDEELLRRVYIVVPNYPLKQSKEDVSTILNQILSESGDEEAQPMSPDEIIGATVRVKAVQEETFSSNNGNIEPMDVTQKTTSASFSNGLVEPAISLHNEEGDDEFPFKPTSQSASIEDGDNQELLYGDLPDSLCIVSIVGLNDKPNVRGQFEGTKSAKCLSSSENESKDTKRRDMDQRATPLRAQSEPILRRTKQSYPRGILRHTSTDSVIGKKPASRNVNFGMVSTREYPIIPGDNPGGTCGPPLTIDWEYQREMMARVDMYEEARPVRRSTYEISMPATVRQQLLRNSGHSMGSIQRSTKNANVIRNQRKSTVGLSHMYALSETTERLTRSVSNATVKRRQKQEEREYIQRAFSSRGGLKKELSQSSLTDEGTSLDEESETFKVRQTPARQDEMSTSSSKLSIVCCLKKS